MKKQPTTTAIPTLRDAYKVSGFRGRARIDSYDELKHPAFVLTLDRRSKKRCAAGAEKQQFPVIELERLRAYRQEPGEKDGQTVSPTEVAQEREHRCD